MTRLTINKKTITPTEIAERNATAKLAEQEWKPIFEAVDTYISKQPVREGAFAQYDHAILHRINLILKRDMLLETLGHTERVSIEAIAERERFMDLIKQNKIEVVVNHLKSMATSHSSLVNKHLVLAEAELAAATELSVQDTMTMNASVAVENKVASKVLSLIKAGGPFIAGVTAADVILAAKNWLDQLPDTQPKSAEMMALQDYVEKNGPEKSNNYLMDQYLHDAAPAQ